MSAAPLRADPRLRREFRRLGDAAYRLDLPGVRLQYDVARLRWERGELWGLLTVRCGVPGVRTVDGVLSVGTLNLTSVQARATRARELQTQAGTPELDFRLDLEELCQRAIAAEQAGTEIVRLRDVVHQPDDTTTIAVYGIPVPVRHPMVWFGHGGTGKTTLAAAFAGELQRRGERVLVLDYETSEYEYRRTLDAIFGDDLPDVCYRRCARALVLEAESIAQQIAEHGITYVVIDSAGYAADGRPEEAEVALRFNRALRALQVGSLTIAHMASGEQGTDKPFGSVFWHNSARATWYLERDRQTLTPDEITVAFHHKKNNLGRLLPSRGLSLRFEEGRTFIRSVDLAEHAEHAAKLPLTQRLRHALRTGPQPVTVLAEELGADVATIERYTRPRGKGRPLLTKVSGADGVTRIALLEGRFTA